jgi:hypothetical protein
VADDRVAKAEEDRGNHTRAIAGLAGMEAIFISGRIIAERRNVLIA